MNGPAPGNPQPLRLFIVEDEALILMELEDRLSRLGYRVAGTATRGEDAIAALAGARADLILMDITLAGELSGIETAALIREKFGIPVVYLTAYSDEDTLSQAVATEPFGYILKPFQERELHATLQMAAYKHGLEKRLQEANDHLEYTVQERTAQLRASEARLQFLLSESPAVICTRCPVGEFATTYISDNVVELTGYPSDCFMDAPEFWTGHIHPDDRARVAAEMESLLDAGHLVQEYRFRHRDGTYRWIRDELRLANGRQGAPPEVVGSWIDVTERRLADEALKLLNADLDRQVEARTDELAASERLARAILDSLVAHVAVLDESGAIVTTNAAWMNFARANGARLDTVSVGADYLRVADGAEGSCGDGASFADGIRKVLGGKTSRFEMEYQSRTPDGLRRWYLARVTRFDALAGPRLVVSHEDITLVREAIGAIEESERKFRSIFDHSPHPIVVFEGPGGKLLEINDAGLRELGLKRAEVIHKTAAELQLWANDGERERYARILERDGAVKEMEVRLAIRHGRPRTVLLSSCVVQMGGETRLLAFLRDITERKLREEALSVLSAGVGHLGGVQFFERVALELARILDAEIGFVGHLVRPESLRMALVACCVDGYIQDLHEYDLAGTPCEGVLDARPLIVPERVQQLYPGDTALADLGAEAYAAVPLFDSTGRVLGHVGILSRRPMREQELILAILQLFAVRLSAEMERQTSERMFKDLVELSPDGILMVGQDGVIEQANRQAAAIFEYAQDALLGLGVEELMPENLRKGHEGMRRDFLATTVPRQMGAGRRNLLGRKRDGTIFPVDISLNPIATAGGRKVIATVRDISAHVKLEQHINRTQRLEAIGTLAGGISHDLNNALFPILMCGETLRMKYPDDQETLTLIMKSAERAAAMVRQLVNFARGAEGDRVLLEVGPLIAEMERIVRSTFPKNIEIAVHIPPSLPTLVGDPTQLHQVMLNFCVNARDAMPEGGTLTLEAAAAKLDGLAAEALPGARPGSYIAFSVSDTGSGIPPEVLGRIFDPFFTTKSPDMGTGLGLANVLSIARGHGGFVNVNSELGNGSTFSVYLPSEQKVSGTKSAGEGLVKFSGSGERILVVDDEEMIRYVVESVLLRHGFHVETAVDGREALARLLGDARPWSAVITDLHMPGMDGLSLVRALREEESDCPVIISSGRLDPETARQLRLLGVECCLEKPFAEEVLLDALAVVLRRRKGAPIE